MTDDETLLEWYRRTHAKAKAASRTTPLKLKHNLRPRGEYAEMAVEQGLMEEEFGGDCDDDY